MAHFSTVYVVQISVEWIFQLCDTFETLVSNRRMPPLSIINDIPGGQPYDQLRQLACSYLKLIGQLTREKGVYVTEWHLPVQYGLFFSSSLWSAEFHYVHEAALYAYKTRIT